LSRAARRFDAMMWVSRSHPLARTPGCEQVVGVEREQEIAILRHEQRPGGSRVVVRAGEPDDDEPYAAATSTRTSRSKASIRGQRTRTALTQCARQPAIARSTQVLSAPDWFSGSDSRRSMARR
jgi:hypothetical protein